MPPARPSRGVAPVDGGQDGSAAGEEVAVGRAAVPEEPRPPAAVPRPAAAAPPDRPAAAAPPEPREPPEPPVPFRMFSSVSSAAASLAFASSYRSRARVSSILARSWPSVTRSPTLTYTFSTVPSAPNASSRVSASTVVPAADTTDVTVPRSAATSTGRASGAVSPPPRASSPALSTTTPARTMTPILTTLDEPGDLMAAMLPRPCDPSLRRG